MDPQSAAFIQSIPGAQPPQQPLAPEPPVFQPAAAPMFPAAAPTVPAAPMMGQPPAPGAQFTPQAPTWPQAPAAPQVPGWPPQQQPMIPGAMPQQPGTVIQQPGQVVQPGQQQPQNGVPLVLPQLPQTGQQGGDMPSWAQDMMTQIQQLQTQGPQDNQPWDDNNRPRTWAELQQSIEKMAGERAESLITEQQQQAQQQQQQSAQLQVQANQNLDAVEGQLQQMGMLPAITNQSDPQDPGRIARQELYAYALAMGASEPQQLGPAASSLYVMHQNGQYFDRNRNAIVARPSQQPGAFAPIAGAGPSMAGGQPQMGGQRTGPTTRELSSMPLSSIAQMGARSLGLGG